MNKSIVLQITLVLIVGIAVTGQIATHANNGTVVERWNEADAYCDQQIDGEYELYNAQAMFGHGGIHCATDDGAVIHIHDVPDAELEHAHEEAAA